MAFDCGLLRSQTFPVPIIGVGNIAVGGTGKTPHVEYILRLLADRRRVAVVSRGYRRKSSGLQLHLANTSLDTAPSGMSVAEWLGDEPAQMARKFANVTVVADANRRRAIASLLSKPENERPQVVVLDDAYQHRYVSPRLLIMLADFARLPHADLLLPAGRLREPFAGRKRADMVIVTKCPRELSDAEREIVANRMRLSPEQPLLFTYQKYGARYPLFDGADAWPDERRPLLLITGIAAPQSLVEHLEPLAQTLHHAAFADHHTFNAADIAQLNARFDSLGPSAFVITTEKDAVRLLEAEGLSDALRRRLYVQPVEADFIGDGKAVFEQMVWNVVSETDQDE